MCVDTEAYGHFNLVIPHFILELLVRCFEYVFLKLSWGELVKFI